MGILRSAGAARRCGLRAGDVVQNGVVAGSHDGGDDQLAGPGSAPRVGSPPRAASRVRPSVVGATRAIAPRSSRRRGLRGTSSACGGASAGSCVRIARSRRAAPRPARGRAPRQLRAGRPVGVQRVGLAAGAVQGEHQLRRAAARAADARRCAPRARRRAPRGARRRGRRRSAPRAPPAAAPRGGRSRPGRTARRRGRRAAGPRHSASASRSLSAALRGSARRASATRRSKRREVELAGLDVQHVARAAG